MQPVSWTRTGPRETCALKQNPGVVCFFQRVSELGVEVTMVTLTFLKMSAVCVLLRQRWVVIAW